MRLRTGHIVCVEFADHVEDGSRSMAFMVYGRVSRVTQSVICVDSWCYTDRKKHHDHNCKRWTIVRAAIKKITILKPIAD